MIQFGGLMPLFLNKVNMVANLFKVYKKIPFHNLAKYLINGSGITLTNNEIKDIMRVVRSFENRVFY